MMRLNGVRRWMGLGLVLGLSLGGPTVAWAQEEAPVPSETPRTFGTQSEVAYVILASEFETENSGDVWAFSFSEGPFGGIRRTGTVRMAAGVRLPAGALITRVELDGMDSSNSAEINSVLISAPSPAGPSPKILADMDTGVTATPGFALFPYTFDSAMTPADRTIDNAGHYYFIGVEMGGSNVGFTLVRVFYRLQVSPAPAVATFGDVPTSHPFFRYVEALVASGITAGCGGGNYCPDAPLTRGQMGVFLSTALGLHSAP